jgi:phage gpG-like protein
MSSITYHATATELIVGTNVKYAPVQQYGATITPKTAKKLAIPADASVRTLMRRHGASVSACLDGLRRAGWKIWLTEGAIMGAPPKGGKSKGAPVVLFIRRDSVDIPPRPFMVIDKDDVQLITDKVTNHVFSFARRRF